MKKCLIISVYILFLIGFLYNKSEKKVGNQINNQIRC